MQLEHSQPVDDTPHLSSEAPGEEIANALKALIKLASPEKGRPHLNCIRMDGGVWCATNGHALMVIDVECNEGATIPLATAKDMIALSKGDKLPWQIDAENHRFVSASRDISLSWLPPGAPFPDWRKILPKDDRTPSNPSFAAPLMKRCMDAMTTLGIGAVTMHIGEAPEEPMLIVAQHMHGDFVKGARIVLMGARP